ncbi:MAG: bifunctional adenosylcobinamide kinase/adenosylcobinamide-phosphate guanylyltransferase, partial [Angelakisella sp.]
MKILITGGCKNGKSFFAQQLIGTLAAASTGEKFYIATMRPCDEEDLARIARHRQEREGDGFLTLEQPRQIDACLGRCGKSDSVLLDSTTALLSNEMFREDGTVDLHAAQRVAGELAALCEGVGNMVLVSDFIYSDAQQYDPLTESYRRGLAELDRGLA